MRSSSRFSLFWRDRTELSQSPCPDSQMRTVELNSDLTNED
ncbi:hypothetical protein [Nostoc sp.]